MSDDRAIDLVVAKLKRLPQDRLQAAVVLEAFVGRKAPDSFTVGADQVDAVGGLDRPAPPAPDGASGPRLADVAVLLTIVISAMVWMPALRSSLGSDTDQVIAWSLPIALAAEGAIRIRYLSCGNVRALRPVLPAVNGSAALLLMAAVPAGELVASAAALIVLWGQATILGVRGWWMRYVALVAITAVALWLLPWDAAVLVGAALVLLAVNVVATSSEEGVRSLPEPVDTTLQAAVIGAACGFMLVVDPGVWRGATVETTAAVLLVTTTGWVASARLSRIWQDLPSRLAAVEIGAGWAGDAAGRAVGGAALGASARVVVPAGASLLLHAVIEADRGLVVVAAFCLFTLAMLSVSLTVAARHWAATAIICVAGAAVSFAVPSSVPALPLLCGSAVVLLCSAALATATFRDAGAAFPTRMMVR